MAEKEQSDESKYNINKNVAYGFLKLIDIVKNTRRH